MKDPAGEIRKRLENLTDLLGKTGLTDAIKKLADAIEQGLCYEGYTMRPYLDAVHAKRDGTLEGYPGDLVQEILTIAYSEVAAH